MKHLTTPLPLEHSYKSAVTSAKLMRHEKFLELSQTPLVSLFKSIAVMTEPNLLAMIKELLTNYYDVSDICYALGEDGYVFVQGVSPVCLCAHLDTVGKTPPTSFVHDGYGSIIANPAGVLGADDRAGVAIMLHAIECLEFDHRPSLLFTCGEERGLLGARRITKDYKDCPINTRLFIGLDRRGSNDYVDYSSNNDVAVTEYFESFGFKEALGSISDVDKFTESWGIPHGNLSVGYYNEHTMNERLNLEEFIHTYNRVIQMCKNPIDKLYHNEGILYDTSWGKGYDWYIGDEAPQPISYDEYCDIITVDTISIVSTGVFVDRHNREYSAVTMNDKEYAMYTLEDGGYVLVPEGDEI